MKKRVVVSNWTEAWKWHSTQVLAFIAAAPLIWAELPDTAKVFLMDLVPESMHGLIITMVAVVGIILRLRDQSKPQPDSEE